MKHVGQKFLKIQGKKLVKSNKSKKFLLWNCIFGSFKLFPSLKIDIWPFLKLQIIFSWNWFIWFHEFFIGLDFLKFSSSLCVVSRTPRNDSSSKQQPRRPELCSWGQKFFWLGAEMWPHKPTIVESSLWKFWPRRRWVSNSLMDDLFLLLRKKFRLFS